MLVLTVQRYKRIQQIYRNSYVPDFMQSRFATLSPRYTRCYKTILKRLAEKTDREYIDGLDTCMWGWVRNAYLDFYNNPMYLSNKYLKKSEKFYAVFCDIPEDEMVLTDYDKYCEYVEGKRNSTDFFVEDFTKSECIQCSFWNLSSDRIKLIIDMDNLKSNNFINEIYNERMNDKSFVFSRDYQKMLIG